MAFKKNGPGCNSASACGCRTCTIHTDDFGDGTITDFTQVSGTCSESSGEISTSDSNAILLCDKAHPDAVPSHYVKVDLYADDGDQLGAQTGNHYALLTIGSGCSVLALYDAADTVLTEIAVTAGPLDWHTLELWYGETPPEDGGESQFAARLNGGDVLRFNVTRSGNSVSLKTGTIASTVRFDNFQYKKHWTEDDTSCPKPPSASENCGVVSDDFSRSDSSDMGCGLSEDAGAWAIVSNTAETSSATAALAILTPNHAGPYCLFGVIAKSSAADDMIRVMLDYQDASNYLCAQVIVGTSKTLKIIRRAGGSDTELGSVALTTSAGSYFTLTFCTQPSGNVIATVGTIRLAVATSVTNNYAAIGTGGTVTGTVSFNSFGLLRIDENCKGCMASCPFQCADGAAPQELKLEIPPGTIAGLNGTSGCTLADCQNVEGTHYLSALPDPTGTTNFSCHYRKCVFYTCNPIDMLHCTIYSGIARIHVNRGGEVIPTYFGDPGCPGASGFGSVGYNRFEATIPDSDCINMQDLELPFLNSNGFRCYSASGKSVFLSAV